MLFSPLWGGHVSATNRGRSERVAVSGGGAQSDSFYVGITWFCDVTGVSFARRREFYEYGDFSAWFVDVFGILKRVCVGLTVGEQKGNNEIPVTVSCRRQADGDRKKLVKSRKRQTGVCGRRDFYFFIVYFLCFLRFADDSQPAFLPIPLHFISASSSGVRQVVHTRCQAVDFPRVFFFFRA